MLLSFESSIEVVLLSIQLFEGFGYERILY